MIEYIKFFGVIFVGLYIEPITEFLLGVLKW